MTERSDSVRRAVRFLALGSFIFFAATLAYYIVHREHRARSVQARLDLLTQNAAQDLSLEISRIGVLAHALADTLGRETLDEEALTELFRAAVESDSLILEAGVAFEPGSAAAGHRLFAPHYGMREGRRQAFRVEQFYDYTKSSWYRSALDSGVTWSEPSFGQATKQWTVGCLVPVRRPGDAPGAAPIGVVRVNYAIRGLRQILSRIALGEEGYGFITSGDGCFIYHPNEDYVLDRKSLRSLGEENADPDLAQLAERVASGIPGMMERKAYLTGEMAWTYYRQIPGTDWSLSLLFMRDEMIGGVTETRQDKILIAIALALFLSASCLLLLRAEEGATARLMAGSILSAFFMTLATAYIWSLSFDQRFFESCKRRLIHDRTGLQDFMTERSDRAAARGEPEPIFVPTGVFLRSIEFKSTTDVVVCGTIWQKFEKGWHDGVIRGVSFPEAVETRLDPAFEHGHADGSTVTVGWDFRLTLRQHFDFSQYPLDPQNVWLYVSRRDFSSNVILVPDIDAYDSLIPQTLPGLSPNFLTAGWRAEKCFFDFMNERLNTNFGIDHFVGQTDYPVLSYNVILRRSFLAPFISNILPLFLIGGIIFALLFMISGQPERITAFDARGGRVTGTSAALFFAVLLAHIRLRNDMGGLNQLIYLEYFYFLMYMAALGVVVDVALVGAKTPLKLVQYRDNFLPKVVFWPLLCFSILLVTAFHFY